MIAKKRMQMIMIMLFCLFVTGGCGGPQADTADVLPPVEVQEMEPEESISPISAEEETETEDSVSETLPEMPVEENGVLEINTYEDTVSVSEDIMIARVSPQELLKGTPVLYDRFRIDGWVFEWLISDYHPDDNWGMEDAVLIISQEENPEDVQIIHVTAEGGYGSWISSEYKFEYTDVNFDDMPDLLICTGAHGNQLLFTYYCFLQTEDGFAESPSFTEIADPVVDRDNKLILSTWRNSAASHSWAEYKYQDNAYILYRELREEGDYDADFKEIWIWTVNGEEIGRSDELSEEEIENLLYNENSEWGILDDRWYGGLVTDYGKYAEH